VISECDPDGWAAGGAWDNPNLGFRNTEYYASWVACAFDKILKYGLAHRWNVKALTWAFLFVGERCFEGTRAFTTQGIAKPVLNLFRGYAKLGGRMADLRSSGARDPLGYADLWGNAEGPAVDGVATLDSDRLVIHLYSHQDDWDREGETPVTLEVRNLSFDAQKFAVEHFRIDASHSNAHTEWVRQGRPMYPSAAQREAIKARDGLEPLGPTRILDTQNGVLRLDLTMPARSVSFISVTPVR
jgi:xylan 1,4-beta-xylosidase